MDNKAIEPVRRLTWKPIRRVLGGCRRVGLEGISLLYPAKCPFCDSSVSVDHGGLTVPLCPSVHRPLDPYRSRVLCAVRKDPGRQNDYGSLRRMS